MIFKLDYLDGFAIITKPCTVKIKVASTVKADKLYTADGHNRWIVNLKAVTDKNLDTLKKLDRSKSEYQYKSITHLLLTGVIWENIIHDVEDLPSKGEKLIATFDEVKGALRCTNITLIPRKEPEVFMSSDELKEVMKEFEDLITNIE